MPPLATPDFRLLFDSALSPLLVLSPDFTIVEVNRAYLTATRTSRTIVGQRVFDVFPDNPDDPSADGVANLRRSLESVVSTGRKDTMALQRYDIPGGEAGTFDERYWSPVNSPSWTPKDASRTSSTGSRTSRTSSICAGSAASRNGPRPRRRCGRRAWRSTCSSGPGRSARSTSS